MKDPQDLSRNLARAPRNPVSCVMLSGRNGCNIDQTLFFFSVDRFQDFKNRSVSRRCQRASRQSFIEYPIVVGKGFT